MDAEILAWVAAHRLPWLDALMWALTIAGTGGALWIAAAVGTALIDRRRRMAAWQIGLAVLLAWAVSDGVLKPIVHRARPPVSLEDSAWVRMPSTPSFPSGHAASSGAGAFMLASAWPAAGPVFWLAAGGVCISRVYLGVHYPSDVLAGMVIGVLVAWFVRGGTRWRVVERRRGR